MLSRYFPDGYARDVFSIDYRRLYDSGCRGIIFDLDNTLVHHGEPSTPEIDELFRKIRGTGLKTVLLTNNDQERVELFIRKIDTDYICDAGKPDPGGYFAALEKMGLPPEKALVIGDQVFIDILGANRSGIRSVLVHYIEAPGERWIGFRRYAEKAILLVWRLRKRLRSITYHKKEN